MPKRFNSEASSDYKYRYKRWVWTEISQRQNKETTTTIAAATKSSKHIYWEKLQTFTFDESSWSDGKGSESRNTFEMAGKGSVQSASMAKLENHISTIKYSIFCFNIIACVSQFIEW